MDAVFANTAHIYQTSALASIRCNREQLLATLHTAAARAASHGHDVLASFIQPLGEWHALKFFTAARQANMGECFFWERPSEQSALVGIDRAATITTNGSTHITAAIPAWRTLLQHAVISAAQETTSLACAGPLAFGGFCFDPLSPHTPLWQGFPDGLLIIPHLLFSSNVSGTTLTINTLVQINEDIEQSVEELIVKVMHLRAALEKLSTASYLSPTDTASLLCLHDLLPASTWMEQVAETTQCIRQGAYEKVVLARGVEVTSQTPEITFDVSTVLQRLRQSYPTACIFAIQREEDYFVGATPERLVCSEDGQLQTMALAGSAPRGTTRVEDEQLGAELLHSAKNQGEHEIVVKTIQEALMKLCSNVWIAEAPHLRKLKNVQHLETPIVGKLLPERNILEALALLHPTPAVGGFPEQVALAAIRASEQLDRGWYAGPVGWLDASGNGEFAVALRSALIARDKATLFAGCGIVADSDPQSEYAESCLKLQVMLRGLGDET